MMHRTTMSILLTATVALTAVPAFAGPTLTDTWREIQAREAHNRRLNTGERILQRLMYTDIEIGFQDTTLREAFDRIEQATRCRLKPLWLSQTQVDGLDPEQRINIPVSKRPALDVIESVIEAAEDLSQPDVSDIMTAMEHVLDDFTDKLRGDERVESVELGDRWDGGTLILQPADAELKSKDMPIDTFFHKIVMTRDRLRVLEAKVNANAKLTDADKVELQQYITKIYGSLTTFNVLFKYKEDQFKGASKS